MIEIQQKPKKRPKKWNKHWDPIWQKNASKPLGSVDDVHIMVLLNAQAKRKGLAEPHEDLDKRAKTILKLAEVLKVRHLKGIGREGKSGYDFGSALFEKTPEDFYYPTPKEHFGFTDGIGDPCFEGQYPEEALNNKVVGRGKIVGLKEDGSIDWKPLATGEFLLGHPDESQELPPTAKPSEFMLNGSFLSYRKLHENVGSFNEVLAEEAKNYSKIMGVGEVEATETLKGKMCGRWTDGVPLSIKPDYKSWVDFGVDRGFRKKISKVPLISVFIPDDIERHPYADYLGSDEVLNFRYADDMSGAKCPLGSHLRRVNTRDYLDPLNSRTPPSDPDAKINPKATDALNKRRRILRRGLPYGPSTKAEKTDDTEQGVLMLCVVASLFRQFEFVQQQWIQYGLDFHQGNSTCPLLGDHKHFKRFVIEGDEGKTPPYVMTKLKTFVECRGGDYFFIPSMSALSMLCMGIVDPT